MIHKDKDNEPSSDAASARQKTSASGASHLKNPLFTVFKGMAWSLSLLLVLLTLPLLVMQTKFGQDLLAKVMENLLNGPDNRMEIRRIHGQIPSDIRIDHLLLADREGVWLEIENLRFSWSLAKLFHGRIQINDVGAKRLRIHRQPHPPSSTLQTQPTPAPKATTWALPSNLPPLLLDRLYVQQIILDKAAFGKHARFSLEGQIKHAIDGNKAEHPPLIAKLKIRPLDDNTQGTQLTLEGKLGPASHPGSPPDSPPILELKIDGRENNGLTSALTGLAQAKGVQFHLAGKGPITDWDGTLAVSMIGLGAVQGQLGFAHNTFHAGPTKHAMLRLEGTAQAEEKGWVKTKLATFLRFPHSEGNKSKGKQIAHESLAVRFAIQAELPDPQHLSLSQIELNSYFATLHGQGALDLRTQNLELHGTLKIPRLESMTPLATIPLEGRLSASVQAKGHWQRPRLKMSVQGDDLAVISLRAKQLKATFEGHFLGDPDQPLTATQITGQGNILNLHHANGASPSGETLRWSANLTARTKQADKTNPIEPGFLHLAKLELKDQNMTVLLRGDINPEQWHGQGDFQVKLARLSHLTKIAALGGTPFSMAGIEGQSEFSGKFTLADPSHAKGNTEPWRMAVTGKFLKLRGLPVAAQALLGSSIQTKVKLALWPGKKIAVSDLNIHATALRMHGNLEADLMTWGVASTVQTELRQLNRLSPLAGVPLAGTLKIDTLLSGKQTAPHFQITLHSDAIDIDQKHLKKISAILEVNDPESTPNGTLNLNFKRLFNDGDDQPVSMGLSYHLKDSLLKLSNFRLKFPGSELTGQQLKLDMVHGIAKGQLRGNTHDLNPLVRWLHPHSQNPHLRGTLKFHAQLNTEDNRQSVLTNIQAQFIRGAFGILEKANFKADLDDLFGEARGKAEVILGKVRWGDRQLHSGKLTAMGSRQLAKITLRAKGQLQETFDLEANGTLGIDSKGVIRGTLAELTGNMGQDSLQLAQETQMTLTAGSTADSGDTFNLDPLILRYGPAHLRGHAHYDAQRLDMDLELLFPLGIATRFGGPDFQGTAQFRAKLEGSPNQPEGQMELRMDKIRIHDPALKAIPTVDILAKAKLKNGQVNAHVVLKKRSSNPISALFLFPVQMGFAPFHLELPPKGKIGGTLNAKTRLADFALMAALDMQKLDGLVDIALSFRGTVETPEVYGDFILTDGRYENGSLGTVLKEINFKATAQGEKITIGSLHASDGGKGHLRATGHLDLNPNKHFPFLANITLENSLLIRREELHSTMSGVLLAHGNSKKFEIKSKLTSNELLFYLSNTTGPDIETVMIDSEIRNGLDITDEKASPIQAHNTQIGLDITIHLPNRVFVRGRGLESEWQGDLSMRGLANNPLILGQVLVRRGYFEFLNRRFDLRKGIVAFDGATPPQPTIDLEAEARSDGNVALLRLHGPAFTPQLKLSSEPELPQDEILARLLFDRDSQQLTPGQALILLAAVQKLRSGGPGLLGEARDSLGFDRLELDGDSVETGSVKAGKYLSDKVFLEVERGLNQGSGKVSMELELTPNITLETEIGENNDNGMSMNWKYDY